MPIGDSPPPPLQPRDFNQGQAPSLSPQEVLESMGQFGRSLRAAVQAGDVPPALLAHFTREFAALYGQANRPDLLKAEARVLLGGLAGAASGTPLEPLAQQAHSALHELQMNKRLPPLQWSAPSKTSPESSASAGRQPSADSARLTQPVASPSDSSRSRSLSRQPHVKKRSPRSGGSGTESASEASSSAASGRSRDALPPPLPNAWTGMHAGSPGDEPSAPRPSAERSLPPIRPVPTLDRAVDPSRDQLMTDAPSHAAGEGRLYVVGDGSERYLVDKARFLRVDDQAMIESEKLGGGAFGTFSIGLMSQPAAEPVLVAIKKARARQTAFGNADSIQKEFARHQAVFEAMDRHMEGAERALSPSGVSPLAAVRATYQAPQVYRAYFDEKKQCGFLLNSVADGDMYYLMEGLTGSRDVDVDNREIIARSFVTQVGTQLGIVHDHMDLVHCDIKIENVLFDGTGQMTLTDFGLSLSRNQASKKPATTIGSMPAPEMFAGLRPPGLAADEFLRLTPKTDVFCLALSSMDMLARDTRYRMAVWHPPLAQGTKGLDRDAQELVLTELREFIEQLNGPPGSRTLPRDRHGAVDPQRLPQVSNDEMTTALHYCATRHSDLTEALLSALESDPRARPSAQQLATRVARGLPQAGSARAVRTLTYLRDRGNEMAEAQPRAELRSLAGVLPPARS